MLNCRRAGAPYGTGTRPVMRNVATTSVCTAQNAARARQSFRISLLECAPLRPDAERRTMSNVQARLKSRLAALVREPSVSCEDPAFDMSNVGVADVVSNWLADAGLEVSRQAVSDTPAKVNVLARSGPDRPGSGLVLSGHLDTVPYDEGRWDTDPFELVERDGHWYGLGSADMKCFFPIVLAALEDFDLARLRAPLIVLGTADEESTMAGARRLAAEGVALGAHALIGEPTDLVPIRKHKGILIGRVHTHGRSGHSSNPALGANALDAMHAVMSAFMAWREDVAQRYRDPDFAVPVPTLNLGRISGGDSPNRICASCTLLFDVRLMPGMAPADVEAELRAAVAAAVEGSGVEGVLELPMEPIGPLETPADAPVVALAESLSGNASETVAFATEGPFLNALGCDTVVLGPGDIGHAHRPNEFVPADKALAMIAIVRDMIERFCCDG